MAVVDRTAGGRGRRLRGLGFGRRGAARRIGGPVGVRRRSVRAAGALAPRDALGAVRSLGAGGVLGAVRRAALLRAERGRRRLPGAVAVGRARRRGRHRAGQAAHHGLVDLGREPVRLRQALVGEEFGHAARIALADGAHLPGALPPVQLQRDDGRLRVQSGEGESGDLCPVEAGDRDEGGRDRAEAGRSADSCGQRQHDADPVHDGRHGVQVHREAVIRGGLAGDLQAGQRGHARMGHPLDAVDSAALVAENGRRHDGLAGRDPDLEPDLGERVVLPPHQLGRHRLSSPCVTCGVVVVPLAGRRPYSAGRIAGIRSWKVRPLAGVPRAVMFQPPPTRCTFAMICAVYAPPPASV